MYLGIISRLVPQGYMVVTIGAPHESVFTVYPDGGFIKQAREIAEIESTDYASWHRLLENRVQMIILVMDYLETLNRFDPELKGLFDLDKVTAIGHSLGGAAVLEATRRNKRIKGSILLDPSFHLIRRDNERSSVPVLLLRQEASTYQEMAASMNETIARDYIDGQRYAFTHLQNSLFYRVNGAQHMSFSDVPLHYNDFHAIQTQAATVGIATAFIKSVIHSGHTPATAALQHSVAVVLINADGEPIWTERNSEID